MIAAVQKVLIISHQSLKKVTNFMQKKVCRKIPSIYGRHLILAHYTHCPRDKDKDRLPEKPNICYIFIWRISQARTGQDSSDLSFADLILKHVFLLLNIWALINLIWKLLIADMEGSTLSSSNSSSRVFFTLFPNYTV